MLARMNTELRHRRARRTVLVTVAGAVGATLTVGAVTAATLLPSRGSSPDAAADGAPMDPLPSAAETTVSEMAVGEDPAREDPAEGKPVVAPEPPFDYGTCPPVARACVDLDGGRAWLQQDGRLSHDAVPVGQGGPGYETPRGTFHVTRKVIDEVSWQFDNTPMPFAVYFTNYGHAFHEGDPAGDSHGCVRLAPGQAEIYFNELQIGDMVHIY